MAKLGLSPNLSTQLAKTLPHVTEPTPTQEALIPAALSPADVILRAHTGSGKSFALLLALLSKPRLLFRHGGGAPQAGISAWIVVPSNELAEQYMAWARALIPPQLADTMHAVIQCVVRGEDAAQQMTRLRETPPHILVGTPTRLLEVLAQPHGETLLGLSTLRTLALDEADALLQLPGRFPSEKQVWRHLAHRAPGLELLNYAMQRRATHSGGERRLTVGLERGNARRPPEPVRRTQYRGAERTQDLATPRACEPGTVPLQLICTSATANSVLRHFLGARTGWLRTNLRETRDTAVYLDQTGMSAGASASAALPREIAHACLVVDTPRDTGEVPGELHLPPIRNLAHVGKHAAPDALRPDRAPVVPSDAPAEHEVDPALLETLAFAFAAEGVARGLALVPSRWSLRKTQAALEALGVPVQPLLPGERVVAHEEPVLYVLQTSSARGLDLPGLSHVFLLGLSAVGDAVHYTHVAGRVSRIGPSGAVRPPGTVVTLLRGHNRPDSAAVSSAEQRMAALYHRLGLSPRTFDLSLLDAARGA
ncbi:hypothetical protein MOBT1_000878 [Malassezia obtusa]|uniref:Helicase ATP-binding domain-containing protein n=1 Tax=Malassezia obtusa TaxID=76774 RepID=A0AAF0DZ42_9BASI|nr:hypothetical protein MOBT1_000878 [Malassezia obtusa]